MAISRAKKTEKVKALAGELEGSTTAIIGTFSKLTVSKDFQLRKVIREAGAMQHGSTVIAFIEDPDGYKIEFIEKGSR